MVHSTVLHHMKFLQLESYCGIAEHFNFLFFSALCFFLFTLVLVSFIVFSFRMTHHVTNYLSSSTSFLISN